MIRYIPFLKAKRGELAAIGELALNVKSFICPFFDFPRKNPDYTEDAYVATARGIAKSLNKHWGAKAEFYFDDLDISQKITVQGDNQYAYVLKVLQELRVIPVVAIGRTEHNDAVAQLKRAGGIAADTVAFRVEHCDFDDYDAIKDEIDSDLTPIFNAFGAIDLIFDCRLCNSVDITLISRQIASFARKFCREYTVRRVIVTGSSIPHSIRDVLGTDNQTVLPRRELQIISLVRSLVGNGVLVGDYATVSPHFAEVNIDPKLFPKITAPRLVYTFNHSHYIARGNSLASGGNDQYYGLIETLCSQTYFRGRGFSTGEDYFEDKILRIGKNATNGTVVKPSVVAHISYMVLGAKL